MAAKIRGAKPIIAIDLNSSRLKLATKLGATHTIDGASPDIAAEINKIAPPNGVKYAVECTGVPKVIERMIETLGTRGRGATIGAPAPGTKVSVDVFSQLAKGAEYVGCCEGDSNNGSVSTDSCSRPINASVFVALSSVASCSALHFTALSSAIPCTPS